MQISVANTSPVMMKFLQIKTKVVYSIIKPRKLLGGPHEKMRLVQTFWDLRLETFKYEH